MRFRYNISDINVKEIKNQFVVDFENYLRVECKCSSNTTAKFIQFFKRIIIIARNNGWMLHDPFTNYKIRIKKVDRGFLTEEELTTIKEKELSIERLAKVRDIFIFSCYTGIVDKKQRKVNEGNRLIIKMNIRFCL